MTIRQPSVNGGRVTRLLATSALTLAVAGLVSVSANAQTSLNPSTRVSTPLTAGAVSPSSSETPLPAPEALVPDIFGLGTYLRSHGIAVLLDNVNEFDGIVSGPHKGSANAGQYGLETDIDWYRLAGIRGFSTHTVMVGRYGTPASNMTGDNINPSQEIYGAGGNVAIHFVYGYGEETLAGGRVDIAAGRMPLLNDFSASPLYCNFQNNAFCGNPKAASDNAGRSSYPDANWAARVRVRPTQTTYVQTGIYFDEQNIYNAKGGYRSGFRLDGGEISGQTFPIEVGWEPSFGPDQLPGHYKVGFAYIRNNKADNYYDYQGNAYVATGLARRQRAGQSSAWVLADQMVMRNGPGATNGLIALAGYYYNDDNTSLRQQEAEVGLIDQGFWKARPKDTIAVAFAYTKVADSLIKSEEVQQSLGLPITTSSTADGLPGGVQSHTMNIELDYQIHVYRGVTFAPDFQYFIRPNAQQNLHNAALLGFKSHIELF